MPELPEVETVVRGLESLRGAVLKAVTLRRDGWRRPQAHQGQTIQRLRRRGKWPALVFNDGCLWLHLGMSGQLRLFDLQDTIPPPDRHDHLDLVWQDGRLLRFRDPRRFGIVAWTEGSDSEPPSREALGPEPLDPSWTPSVLAQALQGVRSPIKPALMDATRVVGVGNIYACEALFLAHVHPARPAQDLTLTEVQALHAAVQTVLWAGIAAGGSTLSDHRQTNGQSGHYQDAHQVYGRAGLPCVRCHTTIDKIVQAGRSTFFCPHCQPNRRSATV